MKKTCSVDKKCLSLFSCFSLPARCKFIVLIFKINFLWFWPPEPENRFPRFFRKSSASGENEPDQVSRFTNTHLCAKYERNRFFNFCRRMLDVYWKSLLSIPQKLFCCMVTFRDFINSLKCEKSRINKRQVYCSLSSFHLNGHILEFHLQNSNARTTFCTVLKK